MKTIFSARTRASTWRRLWIWLAEAEKELGIDISDEAIKQMKANVVMTDKDFAVAAEEEQRWDTSAIYIVFLCLADSKDVGTMWWRMFMVCIARAYSLQPIYLYSILFVKCIDLLGKHSVKLHQLRQV